MSSEELKCSLCSKPERTNNKIHRCWQCKKCFHATCGSFSVLLVDADTKRKFCRTCHMIVTGINTPTGSASSSRSASPCNKTESTLSAPDTASASVSTVQVPSDTLEQIMLKLNKLDKLDDLASKIDKLESIPQQFADFKNSVEARLQKIPEQLARVDEVAAGLLELKRDHQLLAQQMQTFHATSNSTSTADENATSQKIDSLVRANTELRNKIAGLSSDCMDLVISGFALPPNADLKKSAFAVLKSVHQDLDFRDLISTRLLLPRGTSSAATSTAPQSATTSNMSDTPRPPLILATLSSRSLRTAIIDSKIKRGKLLISALNSSLLNQAGFNGPRPEGVVNLNEFLPPAIYRLRKAVREKAKEPDSRFTHFVRHGLLYVKPKTKNSASVPIYTNEDFKIFLALL